MARTASDILIDAPASEVMSVIADFESYPSWATGMKETEILDTTPTGRAHDVRFVLDSPPIRDEFTLRYEWDADRSVSWSLAQTTSILTAMDGAYVLETVEDGSTKVTYQLEVDIAVPLLGLLKRKAEKVIIDTALKGLKRRVEQQ